MAKRLRPASPKFLEELRAKYPAGESSESMKDAVRATEKRIADGCEFMTGEEMGLRRRS